MTMNTNAFVDTIGWIGAIALLVAYVAVSSKRLEGDSMTYQRLNVVGGVFLILNTVYYGAYPSTFVNIVWIAIAFYTIVQTKRKSART